MSKRKPHNMQVRLERSCRALLATNHAAIVSIDPSGLQVMINWKNCRRILVQKVADALCDIPHRWTIYVAGFCVANNGEQYIRSLEATPDGVHRAEKLNDVIEHFSNQVRDECNPNHRVAMGWIAIPGALSISEAQAAKVFEAVGVWRQQKVAA